MLNIHVIPSDQVKTVTWEGDPVQYDSNLFRLGQGIEEFLVVNPDVLVDLEGIIKKIPTTYQCVVWKCHNQWIAKRFNKSWNPAYGYIDIEVPEHFLNVSLNWSKNKDLDPLMTFEDDPYQVYSPTLSDCFYELIWYIDPRFNPTGDQVWARKCLPAMQKSLGVKFMGYLIPKIRIEFNLDLPNMNLDLDSLCPPYYNLSHECAWMLDKKHAPFEDVWVAKCFPEYRTPEPLLWLGTITPKFNIVYNENLPKMEYTIDYDIPWRDFNYEHMWMLDKKHTMYSDEDIWAIKVSAVSAPHGTKIMGSVSPAASIVYNKNLKNLKFEIDYNIPYYDKEYQHVWYVDSAYTDGKKVWAAKMHVTEDYKGEKDMGVVIPLIPEHLDVVFISYHEKNAEENWQRVLEKAPWAKRVNGVKGIFNAHKAAARLSKTDMFYVVDGDAYLVDDWNFEFQPSLFDRDCAYIWNAKNPVNSLTYSNGGVKLFPKTQVLSTRTWSSLDMTTGIMPKLKVIDKVSNITTFNVDEFSTWRSAFRECVKLYMTNQMYNLNIWSNSDVDSPFGKYARAGALAGIQYAEENKNSPRNLFKINDYDWLRKYMNIIEKR